MAHSCLDSRANPRSLYAKHAFLRRAAVVATFPHFCAPKSADSRTSNATRTNVWGSAGVFGNHVLWTPNASVSSDRSSDDNTPAWGGAFATFDFTPRAGFGIQGYQLTFNLSVESSEYVVQPEDDALTGTYPPGTVLYTSGAAIFTNTGVQESYTRSGAYSFSQHVAGPQIAGDGYLEVSLVAYGGMARCTVLDLSLCGIVGQQEHWSYAWSTILLNSVKITPDVVAIPEPSTYAMLLMGMLAVGIATSRAARRSPLRHSP